MATNPIDTASEFITQLYIGYFNRAPDPDGLNYWIGRYNAGMSLVDIANSFAAQSEATSTYGYLAAPNVGSQSSFIQSVYQNLFGRSAEATGLAYWTAQLTSAGAGNEGRVILDMISGASTANGDRQRIENKVEVGVYYAEQYVNNNLTWSTADIGEAQSAVASITFDTATVTSGKTAVDATVTLAVATNGCSIALTTAVDNVTGTSKNDTISAIVGGDSQTLNTALDSINGAGGTDTLSLNWQGTAAENSASIAATGIEIVQVLFNASAAASSLLNLSGIAGVSAVKIGGTALGDIQNMAATATLEYISGNTSQIDVSFASLTGTADTFTLKTNSASTAFSIRLGSAANVAQGIEHVAIVANGNAAIQSGVLNLAGASAQTLTISGSQGLTLDVQSGTTALTSISAAGASGAVAVSLTALGANGNITFVGGAGNDTIGFGSGALNSSDSVSGGAGTDTVAVSIGVDNSGSVFSASTAGTVTGVEVFSFEANNTAGLATISVSALSTQVTALSLRVVGATAAGSGAVAVAGIGSTISTINLIDMDGSNSASFSYTASPAAVTLNIGGASAVAGSAVTIDGTTGQLTIAQAGTAAVTVADLNGSNAVSALISATGTAAMTLGTASFANAASVVVNALGAGTLNLSLSAVHASAVEFNVTANLTAGGLAASAVTVTSAQTLTIDAGTTAGAITFGSIAVGTALNDVNITTLGADVTVSALGMSGAGTNVWSANIAAGGGSATDVVLSVEFANGAAQTGIVFNVTGSGNVTLSAVNGQSASIQINASGMVGAGTAQALTLQFSAVADTAFVVSATLGSGSDVVHLGAGNDVIIATAGGLDVIAGGKGTDTVTFGTAQTGQVFKVLGTFSADGTAGTALAISANLFDGASASEASDTLVLGSGDLILVTGLSTANDIGSATLFNSSNVTWLNNILEGNTAGVRTSTWVGVGTAVVGSAGSALGQMAIYTAAGDTIIEFLARDVTAGATVGSAGVYTITLDNLNLAGNITGTFTFTLQGASGLAITLV